jgi:Spy/CpxP family protein refolding chaperone
MKKLLLASFSLATLAVACTTYVNAQPASNREIAHQQRLKPGQLKAKLGLTDDQTARIKTEITSQKEALRAQALKVRDARVSLRNAIQANAPEPEIRADAAAVGTAEGDLAVVRANLFAHIKPILTPEQLEKLQTLRSARR